MPVGALISAQKWPGKVVDGTEFKFSHEADENGVIEFIATSGKTSAWTNPGTSRIGCGGALLVID